MLTPLNLRNAFFAVLLAVVGMLALSGPALASNADAAANASGIDEIVGHDACAEPQPAAPHGMPSGVLDCCVWTAAADLAALPWPAGNDSVATGSPAVSAILAPSATAVGYPPHTRAASHDLIVLFQRFRE